MISANGIIETSTSLSQSQKVIVLLRSDDKRMANNLSSTVNKFSQSDSFTVSLITELNYKIFSYIFFSVVDDTHTYHRTPFILENMERTEFQADGND